MNLVSRRTPVINLDKEKQIVTSLIVSTTVINRLGTLLEPNLFGLEVCKVVAGWVKSFAEVYNRAPGRDIETIFTSERPHLPEALAGEVEDFLEVISDDYITNPPNEVYMGDVAVDYLKKRKLAKISTEVGNIIAADGELGDAEHLLSSYNQSLVESGSWVNPFDPEVINSVFMDREEPLVTLPGGLHTLLGPLYRKFLVGFMGPMKRGKTRWLIEMAYWSMVAGRRVLAVSLEMSEKDMARLLYQRITAAGYEDGEHWISVMDCAHNQSNLCNMPDRTCRVAMGADNYTVCDWCRLHRPEQYVQKFFKVLVHRPGLTAGMAQEHGLRFAQQFGRDNVRLRCYPPFTANLSTVMRDIDVLAYTGFIPDVVIIDYADILAAERQRNDNRHMIDETWKTLKRLAAEKEILVFTATQGNRASLMKDIIEQTDTSEDIRKLAHVDMMIALSQARHEREFNALRLNLLAHRWKHFDPYTTLQTTYAFGLGQAMLQTNIVQYEPPSENKESSDSGNFNRNRR